MGEAEKKQHVPAEEWRVYLLECADGTLYCGSSNNVARRLRQHNGQMPGGARYTRGRCPVRLLGEWQCAGQGQALRLENYIKKQPREKKLALLALAMSAIDSQHILN